MKRSILLLALVLASCTSTSGGHDSVWIVKHYRKASGLGSRSYSAPVNVTLLKHGWKQLPAAESAAKIEELAKAGEQPGLWVQAAEIRLLSATTSGYILGARDIWRWNAATSLGKGADTATKERARNIYNHCCVAFTVARSKTGNVAMPWQTGDLVVRTDCKRMDIGKLDHFGPAWGESSSAMWTSYRTKGIGGPVLGVAKYVEGQEPKIPYLGLHDTAIGFTAILRFDGEAAVLELHDPLATPKADVFGQPMTLEADYTATLAFRERMDSSARHSSFSQDESNYARAGMACLEIPDPNRIPVMFVHGLRSSPHAFLNLVNELYGDPEIRKRYQIVYYRYMTGFPLPLIELDFHQNVAEFWKWFDKQAPGARSSGYVAVAHSMGGLLIKTLAQDDRTIVWNTYFTKPADQADFSGAAGRVAASAFLLKSDPKLNRMIFLATPHRGSPTSSGLIGGLGKTMSVESDEMEELRVAFYEQYSPIMRPEVRKWFDTKGTSIKNLEEGNSYLLALLKVPFRAGIPFHTVAGDHNGNLKNPKTDGTVPYSSAHLDGAASELVVNSGHHVEANKDCIAEVKRILLVNAKAEGR